MEERAYKSFANGYVYLLHAADGYPIETTDTFLPVYTRYTTLRTGETDYGDRGARWMIGVSVMSGCPVGCLFCATGKLQCWRALSAAEIIEQVDFVIERAGRDPSDSTEFKINYTRMGEPFLNIDAVREAIAILSERYPNVHHYVSTIGIARSDFSWIEGNTTLQVSLHSTNPERRDWLIPWPDKLTLEGIAAIRTNSALKTTLNLTAVDSTDIDVPRLAQLFDPAHFFVKLSPVNPNDTARQHGIEGGVIT